MNFMYSRGQNTDLIFSLQYGNYAQLANCGATVGVTRASSWQSFADSSPYQYGSDFMIEDTCTVVSLVNFPDTSYTELIDINVLRLFFMNGVLQYKNSQDQNTTVANVQIIPTRTYMITVERYPDPNNNSFLFDFTVEDMTTANGGVMTSLGQPGGNPTPTNLVVFRLGRANTSFSHVQSHLVIFQGRDANRISTVQNFMRQEFDGETPSTENTGSTGGVYTEKGCFEVDIN